MSESKRIINPIGDSEIEVENTLRRLGETLSLEAERVEREGSWPTKSLRLCSEHGVFHWFIPEELGGWGWSEGQILKGYLSLSGACLTTTFIITQWHAACRRLISSYNAEAKERILPRLADGSLFATVGISHLTTSRQHLSTPVLRAHPVDGGFILDGVAPWVTGAAAADVLVVGATLNDGNQLLAAISSDSPGITRFPGLDLIALSASCTDRVEFHQVKIAHRDVLFGPTQNVMQASSGGGGAAGGLQTSVLAIGLATAAANFLREQAVDRPTLESVAEKVQRDCQRLTSILEELTDGLTPCSLDQLRQEANSLVLRSTQAALQTAKGAGFVKGHPAGRWAQQALFFLVWSCPQSVIEANLCELAGLSAQ